MQEKHAGKAKERKNLRENMEEEKKKMRKHGRHREKRGRG